MKRFLPFFLAFLFFLSACSSTKPVHKGSAVNSDPAVSAVPSDSPSSSDPALLPRAEIQYSVSDGSWQVELPLILNADTEALQKINDTLTANREYAEELYEKRDGSMWLEWRSYLYQDENSIQILLLQNEYPCYGTDGTLVSWNYDRATDTDIYVQDKMKESGFEEEALLNAIQEAAREPVDLLGAYTAAYLVLDEHTVNFYYTVPQTAVGAETWLVFYTVTCDTETKTCTACFGLLLP